MTIPTIYFDEKIGRLNQRFQRLALEQEHGLDPTATLIEIDDLSRVIRMEAQKWIASLTGAAIERITIEEVKK